MRTVRGGTDVAIGSAPALAPASAAGLEALAGGGRTRHLSRGELLFRQGDPALDVYVLLEGRVEISSVTADGHRVLHTSLLPVQLFGELGPLAGEGRTAAATALVPSLLWSTTIDRFEVFLADEPAAARALLGSLAHQVIATGALVDDLRGLDLRGRLAKRLLALTTSSFDRLPPDGVPVPAIVTQADLADLAGGSREQVTRILGDLTRAGLVGRQGRRVVLTDVAGLARLAGLR